MANPRRIKQKLKKRNALKAEKAAVLVESEPNIKNEFGFRDPTAFLAMMNIMRKEAKESKTFLYLLKS